MNRYIPKEIEAKWQEKWQADGTYTVDFKSDKKKYYGFGMFNYPSGAGIHVGHVKNFTIPDVLLRAKRQQGFEAYSPIGWDSFGMPAENYAIKPVHHPESRLIKQLQTIINNIRQWVGAWTGPRKLILARRLITNGHSGASFSFLMTSWLTKKTVANGGVTICKTVLADEQVISGKCWRHDDESDPVVGKKTLNQWFFKITDFADDILAATDELDWTPWVRTAQKNWIGRSQGAEITFDVDGSDSDIKVFTTRPDTIFGATFMVLAPEHEIVDSITTSEQKSAVNEYVIKTGVKSDLERLQDAGKNKSGVFTGAYAINPANQSKVPIWIGDFVLSGYGTGAIMSVPAHDQRDYEFAELYDLPIIPTFKNDSSEEGCIEGEGEVVNSGEFDGLRTSDAREKITHWLADKGVACERVNYKLRDWLISRQRYWGAPIPIIHCEDCGAVGVPEDQLPVELPEVENYLPSGDGLSPLANEEDWVNVACPKCDKPAKRETDTMDGYVCSSWYPLRYLDPDNTEQAWTKEHADDWMPVDFYNGGDHATAHLLYARFFTRYFHSKGLVSDPEPFKKMYFHSKITAPDGSAFSKSKGNGVDPLEIIDSGYGADALRMYILFMAPPDIESPWNNDGVPGIYRFLVRVWTLISDYKESNPTDDGNQSGDVEVAINKATMKVTDDIENIKFNTAIAALMTCSNEFYQAKDKIGLSSKSTWQSPLESFVQLLAPFAPHIAEELWAELGHNDSVHVDHWPDWDETVLESEEVTMVVQINGKVRANLIVPKDSTEDEIAKQAKSDESVQRHLDGKQIVKTILVPNKLISFVVK